MIAFSTESTSATTSIVAIASRASSAPVPKMASRSREDRPRVGKRGFAELRGAEDDHERDRDHRVDEEPVQALEVHRDLGVPLRVPALADVARCRLHRDHVPGQEERECDVDDQPAVAEVVREEARAVELVEARSSPQSATDGWKNGMIASSVSGIIESSPSTVANTAPNRMPSQAGMATSRMPMTEMTTVQYAIGV